MCDSSFHYLVTIISDVIMPSLAAQKWSDSLQCKKHNLFMSDGIPHSHPFRRTRLLFRVRLTGLECRVQFPRRQCLWWWPLASQLLELEKCAIHIETELTVQDYAKDMLKLTQKLSEDWCSRDCCFIRLPRLREVGKNTTIAIHRWHDNVVRVDNSVNDVFVVEVLHCITKLSNGFRHESWNMWSMECVPYSGDFED